MARVPIKTKLRKVENAEKARVAIVGYTGVSVDLKDMGFEEPMVYNLDGFEVDNNIPYYEEHRTLIGHTIENSKVDGELLTIAEHSVDNERSRAVYNSIDSGEDYEASMGVEVDLESVNYIESGQVQVNNRLFEAPIFVANSGHVVEMTATKAGRDGNTSIQKLSAYQDGKDLLMKIKNARMAVLNAEPVEETPVASTEGDALPQETPPQETPQEEAPAPAPAPVEPVSVHNAVPTQDWLWDYVDDPIGRTLIKNARKEGWDVEKMQNEIQIAQIENRYPGVPDVHTVGNGQESQFTARMALSLGCKMETIEKKLGKKAADFADERGPMGLKESLMLCANANGGRFHGHSDERNLSKHIKSLVVRNAFSTIDYPNLMHQISAWRLEETWLLDAPQSPAYCRTVNHTDFRKTPHIKAKGGKMWEVLDQEGKITHAVHGQEDTYETELTTVAQIITFKREDIINDNIGWIDETLTLMLEGALMIPDYMFVNLWYEANNRGVLSTGNAHTLALTKENLKIVYDNVRRRYTDKKAQKDDKIVNGRWNTRWNLVITPDLEEAAWDIIRQDRIVQNDVKGAAGDVGARNYWFNRLDISVMDNLDNATYHAGARADTWGLIPDRETLRPFYIAYLGRRQRPITETVDLPADELGFGVRGYWDVNMGYRPLENDECQALAISIPTT